MADKKITSMTEATAIDDLDDVLAIVDTSVAAAVANKKMKLSTILDRKVNTLTISASAVTPNMDLGEKHFVSLTENISVVAPTGEIADGDRLIMILTQDATGSRTVTIPAATFAEGDDVAFANLTGTALKTSIVVWQYNSTATKWWLVSLENGF